MSEDRRADAEADEDGGEGSGGDEKIIDLAKKEISISYVLS